VREACKAAGNKQYAAKKHDEAIALYSAGIKLGGEGVHLLYSNRSACRQVGLGRTLALRHP
jgi:hypothetical protein